MTPQEVKSLALTRALKSLADLGAQYTVELDNETYSSVKHYPLLDWTRYQIKKRILDAKAGDTLRFVNLGDDLGKLQYAVFASALTLLGEEGFATRRNWDEDAIALYLFSSPVKPTETELWGKT